jgi:hypothetical protein
LKELTGWPRYDAGVPQEAVVACKNRFVLAKYQEGMQI